MRPFHGTIIRDWHASIGSQESRASLCRQFSAETVNIAEMVLCATIKFIFGAATFSCRKMQKWA